jgi:hypothetical protein
MVDRPYIGCYARTAPVHDLPAVKMRIPDYMTVTVRIHRAGCFFHLQEEKNRIEGVGACEQCIRRRGAYVRARVPSRAPLGDVSRRFWLEILV